MKNLIVLSILFFCTTCTSYDNALLYHKNFVPGMNPLLRFDGYYTEESKDNIESDATKDRYLKPIFFYQNGSVFST
ncbi:MAG TPA: hypothetical protein VFJ43_12480, partial [Bacteroidia bacterium]|nr:hypothetical protein [Bacteroidia bacterium]